MKNRFAWVLLVFMGCFSPVPEPMDRQAALLEMVSTERAFAESSVEHGVRESFLQFFADSGIVFRPHPVRLAEDYAGRPIPETPPPVVLNWSPIYGDISLAADLGYDTGPYTLENHGTEPATIQHGLFFSVWEKQADGNWRVVLDVGVQTPREAASLDKPFEAAASYPSQTEAARFEPEDARRELLAAEQQFFSLASQSSGTAYRQLLAKKTRIHRPASMPVADVPAIEEWLETQRMPMAGETQFAKVSKSGDLGYTYGSYETTDPSAEEGYYARVWKRDDKGSFKIVLDVINQLPQ